ncbi:MAG: DUF3365 domain-containing protein [Sedimenticola sp.]|nr:DUF3365 domain-containing protein [Sedimenticola sp.]
MKRSILVLLLASAMVAPVMADQQVMEARGLVKQFGSNLKGELVKAMKSGGPTKAIEFCNLRAPGIASEVADASGWEIGRTSLKLRSQANSPDAWEMKVLQGFEAMKVAGADPSKLEYAETVEVNGQKVFRYMKAIPTEKACLNCHAAKVVPAVEQKLQALYPEDRARGFNIGDIRGAFTFSKTQ